MGKAYHELTEEQINSIDHFYNTYVAQKIESEPDPVIRRADPPEKPDMLRLEAITAAELLQKKFERLAQAVQGLITEGLILLVGASKIGKSWLVLSMCLATANGTEFLGHATEKGEVLYLALEDSKRRLQSRIKKLNSDRVPENLYFCTDALTLGNGIEEQLENWFGDHPDTRLIVIDTLQMIRGGQTVMRDVYQNDYETMKKLKSIADRHHTSIVLVHHTNKLQNTPDNFDKVSGSTGLIGAADTTILIDRDRASKRATVRVIGRDVYCDDFIIEFESGEWRMVSECAAKYDEDQAYINNPITQTIRFLTAKNPNGLRISYDELRTCGMQLLGFAPFLDSKDFLFKLREIEEQLLKRDRIVCNTSIYVNKRRGILIELRKPLTDFQTDFNM